MKKRDYLNNLTNHVVFTIDTLFKEKNSSQNLRNYLYLISAGMILMYGDNCIEDIYNTISNVKYIESPNYRHPLYYKNPANHNYKKKTIDLGNLKTLNYNYELYFNENILSPIDTLEYLTHELNYVLFAKNKRISIKEKLQIRFNYFTNNIIPIGLPKVKDNIINKVFNILETEEIIKEILCLTENNITNTKFKKALKEFKDINYDTYKIEGYDILTNLLRPLYEAKSIKEIVNSPRNRHLLEKEIDAILGINSYKEICKKIESLWNNICNSNSNNNYYYLSLEYISIRNDYVNRYINQKYAEMIL